MFPNKRSVGCLALADLVDWTKVVILFEVLAFEVSNIAAGTFVKRFLLLLMRYMFD